MNLQNINASASPEVQMNENFATLDCFSAYGYNPTASGGVAWGYYGGTWGGNSFAGGTLTLTDSSDNYIVVARSDGTPSVAITNTDWNDTTNFARVYKVTVAGGYPSSIEDHRVGAFGLFGSSSALPVQYADEVVPTGTVDGANVTFTLPQAPSPTSSILLFLNGLKLKRGVDFTVSSLTITYTTAPATGDSHEAYYRH